MSAPLPTWFISHGGGPWPWVPQWRPEHRALEGFLAALPATLGTRPTAVLVVSAHWEAAQFTVNSAAQPGMLYDYYGFPENTYEVRYPAPGDPALAREIHGLIGAAGLPAALDPERGFDHAAFVPLAVMYPEADVPVLELSLRSGFDPAAHLALGRALAPLRARGVLIVGSGLSYHNLRLMGPAAAQPSRAFDDWLQETLVSAAPAQRTAQLLEWTRAPSARIAHPREDHLLPLMVAVGAAEAEPGECRLHEDSFFGGVVVSSFRFGRP